MTVNRSKTTKIKEFIKRLEKRFKEMFNRDVFSIYEGIVEKVDHTNAHVTIRIPELDDTVYEECRVMMPCNDGVASITPTVAVNTRVIVGFKQFNLNYPIILGQINPTTEIHNGLTSGTITIKNGNSILQITPSEIIIQNGNSVIELTSTGITLNGDAVTAGSDDLLNDDKGAM